MMFGTMSAARMPRITTTTMISMRVKPAMRLRLSMIAP
jgi:hypothetical protein